jgi:ribosomal protein L40E
MVGHPVPRETPDKSAFSWCSFIAFIALLENEVMDRVTRVFVCNNCSAEVEALFLDSFACMEVDGAQERNAATERDYMSAVCKKCGKEGFHYKRHPEGRIFEKD